MLDLNDSPLLLIYTSDLHIGQYNKDLKFHLYRLKEVNILMIMEIHICIFIR